MESLHGGAREGAGRKPLDENSPTVKVPVRISDAERTKLARLGGSAWARECIDATPLKQAFKGQQERGPTVVATLRMTEAQYERYVRLGGGHWLRSILTTVTMPRKRAAT